MWFTLKFKVDTLNLYNYTENTTFYALNLDKSVKPRINIAVIPHIPLID